MRSEIITLVMPMPKFKAGIIVDEGDQSKQIFDLVQASRDSSHYEISLLVVQTKASSTKMSKAQRLASRIRQRGIARVVRDISFGILCRVETLLAKRASIHKELSERHTLKSLGIQTLAVRPTVSKSGLVYRYTENDIAAIKKHGLDLLIRGGSGILRGEILTTCRFGIISFHHADNDVNRGGPPAFWEVYHREPSTGFVIQILKDELDGGDVILKGSIPTSRLYLWNQARLYGKSNVFMHRAIERIAQDDSLPEIARKVPYGYPLYVTPGLLAQASYATRTAWHIGRRIVGQLLGRKENWGVAYQFVGDWREAAFWKARKIENPPGHFLADPFVVKRDGRHVCFVEDFDHSTQRGCITAYEINKDGHTELGAAIEEDFHMSYPFLLEDAGELYMCPETHEAAAVRIYRCVEFPLKWELADSILEGTKTTDSSIFKKDGRWWLLTNIDSSPIGDYTSELHVFSAKTLLNGNWVPHQANPVVFDSRCARNGGLIVDNENVFRVFQVQGWDLYGERFGVARIDRLSDNDYSETVEFIIPPRFFKNIKGTHTYNYSNGVAVFDFVEFTK